MHSVVASVAIANMAFIKKKMQTNLKLGRVKKKRPRRIQKWKTLNKNKHTVQNCAINDSTINCPVQYIPFSLATRVSINNINNTFPNLTPQEQIRRTTIIISRKTSSFNPAPNYNQNPYLLPSPATLKPSSPPTFQKPPPFLDPPRVNSSRSA